MPPHIHDINKCIPVAMKKSVFPILILCLFLWRPDISLTGAKNGLTLWAGVILPTLLPFMICSGAIVSFGGISLFTKPFRPILHGILGFSQEGSYVFLSGLLCGYPMGAKNCRDFLSYGMISPEEGRTIPPGHQQPSQPHVSAGICHGRAGHCLLSCHLSYCHLSSNSAGCFACFPFLWVYEKTFLEYQFPTGSGNVFI